MTDALGAPWARPLRGTLDRHAIDSAALRDNPLGDPHVRPLWVYTPPDAGEGPLPSVYLIQGFTGQVDMWASRPAMRPTVLERIDALFAGDEAEPPPPCLVVFVDCWTSVGGSQFLDSPGTGRYHTHLCDEVVPFVDARHPTAAAAAHRGIAGKSSGGYGAMVTPMLRPDLFGGLATHAGDALFEVCYAGDFAAVARTLRDSFGGDYDRWRAEHSERPALSGAHDAKLFELWGYASAYSAEADGTVRLPFDPATGGIVDEVWQRWLAWDPVRMVPSHADALRGLRAVWIDAGTRDEWYLDLAAEAFRRALVEVGVTGVAFELFDAAHGGIEYRYPLALRHLAERLAP